MKDRVMEFANYKEALRYVLALGDAFSHVDIHVDIEGSRDDRVYFIVSDTLFTGEVIYLRTSGRFA